MRKSFSHKNNGKQWWNILTREEQQAYIAKKERQRKSRTQIRKDERWTNNAGTFIKHWIDDNSYSIKRLKKVK